ncbi:hypothetical protein APU01nite_12140 [Alkalibacterium putridalgicola]|uniref:Uncharacterized protein n=1 Tax=Alkalibacterium putridalgicola TaxID=426703 RepID=A0ABQ0UXA6_9LACT|nr:hypothetical protein APU01nite_12140 [Alkalibacterium putridalgicola]
MGRPESLMILIDFDTCGARASSVPMGTIETATSVFMFYPSSLVIVIVINYFFLSDLYAQYTAWLFVDAKDSY